jgi:putative ABC transport system permease protein
MALPRVLETLVRRLAGPDDAESLLADLECEPDDRSRRDGDAAARRWLWAHVARSTPPLLGRRVELARRAFTRGSTMFHRGLWLDLQLVVRRLRRSPGFAVLAIAMLGVGIGAAASVFNLAYTIWLEPLPYRDADRLVTIVNTESPAGLRAGLSNLELQDVRDNVPGLAGIAGYSYSAFFARFGDEPARVVATSVSANLFAVLGVTPQVGRAFTPDDEGQDVALLSDAFWRSRFHADPRVIGTAFGGREERFTIVGVMPRDFRFPLHLEGDCWVPSIRAGGDRAERVDEVVARLAPGVTIARANAELASLSGRLAAAYPATNTGWTMAAGPYEGTTSPSSRAAFITLLSMVGLFLLIACANLANLFVARNLARRHELTVALAIGAPRWRLARLVLIESALISAVAGAIALLLSSEATTLFAHWLPSSTPRLGNLRFNAGVFMFALATAACTAALCAIAPVANMRSLRLADSFTGARTIGGASHRGQSALVIAEVTLAAVLLMGGGAMVRSFGALLARDRGYVPAGVVTMTVSLPFDDRQYTAPQVRADAFDRLIDALRPMHGVTAAGAATGFPGSALGILGGGPVTVPGRTDPPVIAALHDATPDYFRAMGVPITKGRAFTDADTASSPRVVIINDTMARLLFPDGRALGQRFHVPSAIGLRAGADADAEVVGLVADMHLNARRTSDMFVPFAQVPSFWADVVVRTSGDPAAMAEPVRQAIRRSNPDALIEHVSPLQAIISNAYGLERAQSFLTALVAALGGAIALMGLYALLSQYVARRTREMGICLALGSSPARLFWSVFRRGMLLSGLGVGIGLAAALLAARLLRGQVFGLDVAGVWLFLPVALGVALASAIVIASSARRVIRIDPLVALRQS